MLRVATAVSHYPFYNVRYLKLLHELSKVFDVYVFAGSRPKTTREEDKRFKLCYTLPFIIPKRVRYYVGPLITQPLLNLIGPDVIWLFDTAIPLTPLMIKTPIILDIDDPKFKSLSKLSLIRGLHLVRDRRVKKVVVPTNMIKKKLVRLYDIPEDKIEVIPNGVDLELFKPSKLPEEDVVLYYGTLAPSRSRFLVKAVEETLKLKKDIKFIIIGNVPVWLKRYFADRNIIGNITMPGYIEHDSLPQWVAKAKLCIFPQDVSLGRGSSLKLLEYMALGRPIVATDVDEAWPIREAGAGIISPLDPKVFAENIIKILEDRELAEKLAERGASYAKRFSWDQIANKYIELIKDASIT
jgi:glycosyltransferase involved in cell wall biosynthesis